MILDRKQRQMLMPESFHCIIIQINMRNNNVALGNRVGIHGIPVVLGRYMHFAGNQVLDRVVSPPVPKFKLVCGPSQSQSDNLVAQAYSKYGLFPN